MNKWVCVNATSGVVLYTMQLANDADVPSQVDGQEFVAVDFESQDSELIGCYYDFDAKKFIKLPSKPSDDYDFDGVSKNWVINFERATNSALQKRQILLYECDWTQLPDAPVNKEAWASYRQALRDITTQPGYPQIVDWPIAPQ